MYCICNILRLHKCSPPLKWLSYFKSEKRWLKTTSKEGNKLISITLNIPRSSVSLSSKHGMGTCNSTKSRLSLHTERLWRRIVRETTKTPETTLKELQASLGEVERLSKYCRQYSLAVFALWERCTEKATVDENALEGSWRWSNMTWRTTWCLQKNCAYLQWRHYFAEILFHIIDYIFDFFFNQTGSFISSKTDL